MKRDRKIFLRNPLAHSLAKMLYNAQNKIVITLHLLENDKRKIKQGKDANNLRIPNEVLTACK